MAKSNPLYGSGIFRRRLLLQVADRKVSVELEDDNHGFRLRLLHDGKHVVALEVDAVRHPFNTCPEAVRPLQRLIGLRMDEEEATLRKKLISGANCTHMYDMALIAMANAGQAEGTRLYDMEVDDERDGVTAARIFCDGQPIHDWTIRNHQLVSPAQHAGQPVMRGFYAWVSQVLTGMPREAASMLQRAYFVAQSRRYNYRPAAEHPAASDDMPEQSCYSYNAGVVERAFRSDGTIRSFAQTPESLLKFLL